MDPALLDELEQQHRSVEDLLSQMEHAKDEDDQRRLVDDLLATLEGHMATEEAEVYPELSKLGGEMVEEATNEHTLTRHGLRDLDGMVGQPGFGAAVAGVQATLAHHFEEEEEDVFPKVRDALNKPGDT